MRMLKLRKLNPCAGGLKFAESFKSMQAAWEACIRPDWMLWLLGELAGPPNSESRKNIVRIACRCARMCLKHVREDRPLKAVEAAEGFLDGKA